MEIFSYLSVVYIERSGNPLASHTSLLQVQQRLLVDSRGPVAVYTGILIGVYV